MSFFGKFRRKLVLNGKFRNYLIYAFGEILLIVIGILIAWKINNLNEIRKNKIVEVKIYETLYDELRTNLNVIDSAIVRYNTSRLSLKNTLHYVGLEIREVKQETKNVIIGVRFKETSLRNDALNSINNTNKFEFLENDALKGLIAAYPNEIKIFKSQENKIENIVENRLKPIIEKHISLADMLPENEESYIQIKTFGAQSNYTSLLNSRDYQNSIIDRLLQTDIQLKYAKSLRFKTEKLAIKLKQELE